MIHHLQYSGIIFIFVNCELTYVPAVAGRIICGDGWGGGKPLWGQMEMKCVGTDGDWDEPLWGQMGMKCVGTDTDGDETL